MRRVAVVLLVMARTAMADDGIRMHVEREEVHEPYLSLDPMFRSNMEGLTVQSERHETDVSIGGTHVILEGIAAANVDRPEAGQVTEDVASRSWRAGVRIARKIGPFDFEAWGAVENVQTRYGRGTYRDVGVSIAKRFSLSKWMKAWVALTLSNRQWLDDKPPDGEANGTSLMLSVGTTFR